MPQAEHILGCGEISAVLGLITSGEVRIDEYSFLNATEKVWKVPPGFRATGFFSQFEEEYTGACSMGFDCSKPVCCSFRNLQKSRSRLRPLMWDHQSEYLR